MPIGSEFDRDIIRPKHQMAVPGLGVFIAPNAVARLFQLHDYTKCPPFGTPQKKPQRVLYPILRPNVMHCPRYYHLRQAVHVHLAQAVSFTIFLKLNSSGDRVF